MAQKNHSGALQPKEGLVSPLFAINKAWFEDGETRARRTASESAKEVMSSKTTHLGRAARYALAGLLAASTLAFAQDTVNPPQGQTTNDGWKHADAQSEQQAADANNSVNNSAQAPQDQGAPQYGDPNQRRHHRRADSTRRPRGKPAIHSIRSRIILRRVSRGATLSSRMDNRRMDRADMERQRDSKAGMGLMGRTATNRCRLRHRFRST